MLEVIRDYNQLISVDMATVLSVTEEGEREGGIPSRS